MSTARNFLVTWSTDTAKGRVQRTQVWDSKAPLALGSPFRWVVERTESGVRVRDLSGAIDRIQNSPPCELLENELNQGAEVALPGERGTASQISIRPVERLMPMYIGPRRRREDTQGPLRVHACFGHWLMRSDLTDGGTNRKFTAYAQSQAAFRIQRAGAEYTLEALIPGLAVRNVEQSSRDAKPLAGTHKLTSDDIISWVVSLGPLEWRFEASMVPSVDDISKTPARDEDSVWYQRSMRAALLGFGAFMILSWLWPKPSVDTDLIPAQFAKIVMTAPKPQPPTEEKAAPSAGATASTPQAIAEAPKTVQKAAVVQAFRAKALQSAVSGLLRGGMTTLLAQSDFVAGKEASANARRMLDTKSEAMRATAQDTGAMNAKNVEVSAIGGEAGAGANGTKGVGYGKGERANVKGQGKSLVSMDIAGASVEEGLTKDEVGEVIHRHMSEVRYCYESAMIRTPDIEGKLMVAFTIGGAGQVKTSAVKSSTLPDPRLDDCILRRLMTWKFPNTKGGIDVAVSYPFIFKSLGR